MSRVFWTVVKDIPGEELAPVGSACLMANESDAASWADTLLRSRPGVFRVARCVVDLGFDRPPDQVNPPVGPPDSDRSFLGSLAQRVSALEAHDKDRADIQIRLEKLEAQSQDRGAWVCRLENLESKVDTLRRWRDRVDTAIKKLCDLLRAADAGVL